jgi:hypothetical protein
MLFLGTFSSGARTSSSKHDETMPDAAILQIGLRKVTNKWGLAEVFTRRDLPVAVS